MNVQVARLPIEVFRPNIMRVAPSFSNSFTPPKRFPGRGARGAACSGSDLLKLQHHPGGTVPSNTESKSDFLYLLHEHPCFFAAMLGRDDKGWGGCYGSLFKKGRELAFGGSNPLAPTKI